MTLEFTKVEGLGNDFVVFDNRRRPRLVEPDHAKEICDRHLGVGADGVLTILPSRAPEANARMHIYNSDGSVAQMCGNGLRCVIQQLAEDGRRLVLDTDAGLRRGRVTGPGVVEAELGEAACVDDAAWSLSSEIPHQGCRVDVGNPHFVLDPFEDFAAALAAADRFGAQIASDGRFPEGTNVEFYSVEGDVLHLVVHERGVGQTLACGTGAAAAALVHCRAIDKYDDLQVELPGGRLSLSFSGATDCIVTMSGPARKVFEGTL